MFREQECALENIVVKEVSYQYTRRNENDEVIETLSALSALDFSIETGSFVCILGHNGSGKSTLAKLFNALQLPTEGTILVSGMDSREEKNIFPIRREVGMVFQNPDNQIIASVVEEDVGFGPENIGLPTDEIWQRVNNALSAVHMEAYRLKSPNHLSGGQKQRVAIAGTLAMEPKTIVLDEPTAMLDPSGRKEVLESVLELKRKKGISIILITHYMEEAVDADRILLMDSGKLVMDGSPREVFQNVERLKEYRMDVPLITELAHKLQKKGFPIEKTILKKEELEEELFKLKEEGFSLQESFTALELPGLSELSSKKPQADDYIVEVEHLSAIFQEGTAMESYALKDLSVKIRRGSLTAVIGHTGSGKSTLVQHLNGLIKAKSGEIFVSFRENPPLVKSGKSFLFFKGKKTVIEKKGRLSLSEEGFDYRALRFKVGLVFQYPEYQLFEETVLADVMFGPLNQGKSREDAEALAKEALASLGIGEELYAKSPFELSGGQKRKVAIAGVLAMGPELLILDEPTAGLDPAGRDELFEEIAGLRKNYAMTILLVSHSMDDVARYADEVLVLHQGELKIEGTVEEVFSKKEELESMGLGLPQIRALLYDLKKKGLEIPLGNTVSEAVQALSTYFSVGFSEGKGVSYA
ncbi:energy-coupling factor transporter ATPase [Oribacterium sp. oral taxon 108]|uniref:energy-coupling factor transporter ATPase n=1 Tax=Oribacterium sp. oral taxon 108 TaxID=712414 RepID=UPI00020DDEB5|nr:energy-coupling factor transporter ATPase [Oribacterium sp. oral taxon 108]EGL37739.1 cobalt ABC transporter, ATP-binding protein [Oribacterium sp. oral taxon 108 str. F0425]